LSSLVIDRGPTCLVRPLPAAGSFAISQYIRFAEMLLMIGKCSSVRDERIPREGIQMRAIKAVFVSVVMTASVVTSVAAIGPAASGSAVASRWCC